MDNDCRFLDGTLKQRFMVVVATKFHFWAIFALLLLCSSFYQRSLSLSFFSFLSLSCLVFLLVLCGAMSFTFFCDSVQIFLGVESCTKNNPPWEERRRGLREECRHNNRGGLIDELSKEGSLKSGIDGRWWVWYSKSLPRSYPPVKEGTLQSCNSHKEANLFKLIVVCWKAILPRVFLFCTWVYFLRLCFSWSLTKHLVALHFSLGELLNFFFHWSQCTQPMHAMV